MRNNYVCNCTHQQSMFTRPWHTPLCPQYDGSEVPPIRPLENGIWINTDTITAKHLKTGSISTSPSSSHVHGAIKGYHIKPSPLTGGGWSAPFTGSIP